MTPLQSALREAELYLQMLTAHAPVHALLDVRYRAADSQFGRLFLGADPRHAAGVLARIACDRDVYVGCAPLARPPEFGPR